MGVSGSTSASSDQIGQITLTGLVTLFDLPSGTRGVGITLGPDGALWMCTTNNTITRAQVPVTNGSFAHVAAGGSWTTLISLVNTTTVPITLTTALYGDDGSPLALPITTTAQGTSQTTTAASVSATASRTRLCRSPWVLNSRLYRPDGPRCLVQDRSADSPSFARTAQIVLGPREQFPFRARSNPRSPFLTTIPAASRRGWL